VAWFSTTADIDVPFLQVLSVTLSEKTPILQVFQPPPRADLTDPASRRLGYWTSNQTAVGQEILTASGAAGAGDRAVSGSEGHW
jgi:hypothetical protein